MQNKVDEERVTLPKNLANQVNKVLVGKGLRDSQNLSNDFSVEELNQIEQLWLGSIEQCDEMVKFPNLRRVVIGSYNTNRPFYPLRENQWRKFVTVAQNVERIELHNLFGLSEFDCSKFKNLKQVKLQNCQDLKTVSNYKDLENIELLGNENLKFDAQEIVNKILKNYKEGKNIHCDCDLGMSYQIMQNIMPIMLDDENFINYLYENIHFKQPMFHGGVVKYDFSDVVKLVFKTQDIIDEIIDKNDSPEQKAMNILVWLNKNCRVDYINAPQMDDNVTMGYVPQDYYLENLKSSYPLAENGIYGPIMEGRAICEGAARGFSYLCNAAGVETSYLVVHRANKDFQKQVKENSNYNENIPATHIMNYIRLNETEGTLVDAVGVMRKLDTKIVDNFNFSYRPSDLERSGVVVRHMNLPTGCVAFSTRKILGLTKNAYVKVYDVSNPEKFTEQIRKKNKTRDAEKKEQLKKRREVIEEEKDETNKQIADFFRQM